MSGFSPSRQQGSSPGKYLPLSVPVTVTETPKKPVKRKRSQFLEGDACLQLFSNSGTKGKRKRRKSKWSVEPDLSLMRKAILACRYEGLRSSVASSMFAIPDRTLRRYLAFSYDSASNLFYLDPETVRQYKQSNPRPLKKYVENSSESEMSKRWSPKTAVEPFMITDDYDDTSSITAHGSEVLIQSRCRSFSQRSLSGCEAQRTSSLKHYMSDDLMGIFADDPFSEVGQSDLDDADMEFLELFEHELNSFMLV